MKDQRHLNAIDYAFSNLCGEDALGRQIKRINGLKKDKTRYVGMFYSLWLGGHKGGTQQAVYDITELEKTPEGVEALNDLSTDPGNPNSPVGQFHFWGQPLYGYYDMSDPFVVTRHIELFINAGLDYLCIDATNSVLYYDATFNLLNLLMKFQKQGYNVPKVMFYTNSHSGPTVKLIYNKFYIMILVSVKFQSFGYFANLTVYSYIQESPSSLRFEKFFIMSFPVPYKRCQKIYFVFVVVL